MNSIELLASQTASAYQWTNKLLKGIPDEQWMEVPESIATSAFWQCGHLMMSAYYHSIWVIQGHHKGLAQSIPMQEYAKVFTSGPAEQAAGIAALDQLKAELEATQEQSLETIRSLKIESLADALEETGFPHPVAKTKGEALTWNIQHTMWHCGQISTLKRILGHPYEFKLGN